MPKKSPHPYCVWRDGRPRFLPSPRVRAEGHEPRDLKHDDGTWFTFGETCDFARAFMRQRAAQPKVKRGRPKAGAVRRVTLGKMVEQWQASQRWTGEARRGRKPLSANTIRDYRQKLAAVAADFPELWSAPAEAVSVPVMQRVHDELEEGRGLATARGAIAVLSSAWKWALTRGVVRGVNPCKGLDKAMPPPRVRFGTRAEIVAIVAAADSLGLPSVGDAILLGLWTGQRQGDRLSLCVHSRLGKRRVFRQSKTGAIVAVLEAPELEARLALAGARRRAAGVVDPHVILNEQTWRPYVADTFRHDFARVREAAAGACPSVATLRDQDLRDTAVTWMALAGAEIPEICAVTGHSTETAHQMLKHYLARHPEMADSAIRKMVRWYEDGGETEIGL